MEGTGHYRKKENTIMVVPVNIIANSSNHYIPRKSRPDWKEIIKEITS